MGKHTLNLSRDDNNMSGPNSFGRKLVITIFGESHGKGIGVTIDGIPSDLEINKELIQKDLNRRRPGQSKISTPRDEKDEFQIISGVQNNKTTGAPLTLFIENTNVRSKDYSLFRKIHRPSQIDYPALLRYGENVDLRGSGIFSGRLTAPIVMAGGIAKQILAKYNVQIGACVKQVGNIRDLGEYTVDEMQELTEKNIVRAVNPEVAKEMIDLIDSVRDEEDSIGGIVEVRVENYPKGIGDPWFQSLESMISWGITSIPAVRGIEFGTGFAAAEMKGSEHNDPYIINPITQKVETSTNNCGGIIGGISIGTPIVFRVAIKPTASIGKPQKTLDFETQEMTELKIEGRHDPCIVPRALVGIEAMTAIVLLDALFNSNNPE